MRGEHDNIEDMIDFDLQIQSSASDGTYSPRELAKRAADLKLKTIAITDHDTIAGVSEALTAGEDYDVEVITGIEISAVHEGLALHILGFGIDYRNPALLQALHEAQEARVVRAKEIVSRLQKAGFEITYEEVLHYAKGSSVGRPHISLAVLNNPENKKALGDIRDVGAFIRAYLVPGKETYVGHENISVQQAIDLIHRALGVAAWSHPAIHGIDPEKIEPLLKKFIEFGMDGIEAFNPSHTEEQVKLLRNLAAKYGILETGGSDFHTDEVSEHNHEGGAELASFLTYGLDVLEIVPKLKEAIARTRQ